MQPFKEINLPSLTERVRGMFWDHINPYLSRPFDHLELDKNNPDHKEMFKVISEYPFLSEHMVIFKMPCNFSTAIHVDGFKDRMIREYSCNIPIQGCSPECVTEFYQVNLNDLFEDSQEHTRLLVPNRPAVKIAEYSLDYNPVLVHTQTAHRVNNMSNTDVRISVSWSVRPDWTIEQIAKTVDLRVIV